MRRHPLQEVFAGTGIAVGVALIYAVLVSSTSITGAAAQIVDGVAGRASLQLTAVSDRGFDESVLARTERVPGVVRAVPVLRSNVRLIGPDGQRSVQLWGTTPELPALGGDLASDLRTALPRPVDEIALPENVAQSVGASPGRSVRLHADGLSRRVPVAATPADEALGALAGAASALASLSFAQEIANRDGRLSHILVEVEPGQAEHVRPALERIAGDDVRVSDANVEMTLLRQATKPNDQPSRLFAMVGFLFALSAMLFTVAERRRFVAGLRLEGASPRQSLAVLAFEVLALGVVGSVAGLLLGELLLRTVFADVPDYLTFAFPVSTEQVVRPWAVAVALGGGMLAAVLAALRPALDLRARLPLDAVNREHAEPGEAIGARAARRLLWLGIALVSATTLMVIAAPEATAVGGVTLAIAAVLVMPATFGMIVAGLARLTRSTRRFPMLAVALIQLRATATRSVALTAVAALAVYGSIAIDGAREDVVRGLDSHTRQWLSNADIWVTTGGQDVMTNSFEEPGNLAALRRAEGVRAVRLHRGGFLDLETRRIWLLGRHPSARTVIPPSQMLDGDLERATARLRRGGWATASAALAEERGIGIGDHFSLPTPTGDARFRLAATTMNFGWIPGAVTVNGRDYVEAMGTTAPSALEVDLEPGVAPADGKRLVAQALGPGVGLTVQTRAEREEQYYEFGREGVSRLSHIASLLLLAAALAIACAVAATMWERRPGIAALKVQGARRGQLWRAMLFETGLLVTVGCLVGTILGVYGHLLAGRFLRTTTGFAAPFSVETAQLGLAIALVAGGALAISAIPGYLAVSVPARKGFRE